MQKWLDHKVPISIALSILLHLIWLTAAETIYPKGEGGIIDAVLGWPSFHLTVWLVPEQFLNKGLLIGLLILWFISFLFYAIVFWLILILVQRFIRARDGSGARSF